MLLKKMGLLVLNKLSLLHWHIELSSICTLKCPRCPRAEVPDSLLNKQLSLDFFKNQIGKDAIKQMRKITFCGNDGDPIYCNDLIPIIKWIKQVNNDVCIVLITKCNTQCLKDTDYLTEW
jgi:MoaA/NifB/PqqE/SkfB family radical SAM enzyme